MPCIPRHLETYHRSWLETLSHPLVEASTEEMVRELRGADLLLVSDFHPLRRSRDGLARLLDQVPQDRPLVLGLEMLPYGTTLTVDQALRQASTPMMHGQILQEAYAPVLEVLRGRRAILVGTWVEGSVQRRDAAAAEVWQRMRRRQGRFRGVFHFGDWHLAEDHLPRRLEALGERPVVIHQSPEPVWERVGLGPRGWTYRLAERHWAWLQTPPLGLWADHLQDAAHLDPEEAAEAGEHLCESAADLLARTLGMPSPQCRMTVVPADTWRTFHGMLPRRLAASLEQEAPPCLPVFHPRLPMVWSPGPLDLGHIMQGAAHTLTCSSAVRMEVGLLPEFRRQVFRRLCAHLVNPFLDRQDLRRLAEDLLPEASRQESIREARAHAGRPQGWNELAAGAETLLLQHQAQQAAATLARRDDLDHDRMRKFLDPAKEAFDWEALMATIRVA